jgi:hypothetical protein
MVKANETSQQILLETVKQTNIEPKYIGENL